MNMSLTCSGQMIADLSDVSMSTPAAEKVTRGSPLMSMRRLFATHVDSSLSLLSVVLSRRGASIPAAKRHLSVSVSPWYRNSAHPDQGTSFDSFDEIKAMV